MMVSESKESFLAYLTLRIRKIELDKRRKKINKPFRSTDTFGISLNLFKIIRIIIQNYNYALIKLFIELD